MSTVDDAVQAGARALWSDFHADEDPAWVAMSWDDMGGSEPTDERGEYEIAAHAALAAAWPVLSAPIREMVTGWREDAAYLMQEGQPTMANCTLIDASALEKLVTETDKELGL